MRTPAGSRWRWPRHSPGNLTITGSIANIIVVERPAAEGVHVGFREYVRVGLPLTAVTLVGGSLWLWSTAKP